MVLEYIVVNHYRLIILRILQITLTPNSKTYDGFAKSGEGVLQFPRKIRVEGF